MKAAGELAMYTNMSDKYIDANMSEKYMKTAGELPMYTNMSDKYIDAIYQGNI